MLAATLACAFLMYVSIDRRFEPPERLSRNAVSLVAIGFPYELVKICETPAGHSILVRYETFDFMDTPLTYEDWREANNTGFLFSLIINTIFGAMVFIPAVVIEWLARRRDAAKNST